MDIGVEIIVYNIYNTDIYTEKIRKMKLYTREEFVKLPAGILYTRNDGHSIEIKGDWVSDDGSDWTCTTFGNTGDTGKVYLEMLYGESYPIKLDYYGRDGCFEEDAMFIVYESWDLEQMKQLIERAIPLLPPQQFKNGF